MIEQIKLLLKQNDLDSFKLFFTKDKVDCLSDRTFRDVMLHLTENLEFFIHATQIKEPFWKECFLLAFYKSNKKTCQYILSIGKFDLDILINEKIANFLEKNNVYTVKIDVTNYKFGNNLTVRKEINSVVPNYNVFSDYQNHIDEYVSYVCDKTYKPKFNKWIYYNIHDKSNFTENFKKMFIDDDTNFLFFIYIINKMIDSPIFDLNVLLYCLKEFII